MNTTHGHRDLDTEQLSAGVRQLVAGWRDVEPDAVQVSMSRLRGGLSRQAWSVDVEGAGFGAGRHVLLLFDTDGLIEGDAATEFSLLQSLSGLDLPVPTPHCVDPTGQYVGRPGYLMERIEGSADVHDLRKLGPDRRARLDERFLSTLAALHRVDPAALPGVDWEIRDKTKVNARVVERWWTYYRDLDGARQVGLDEVFAWLTRQAPDVGRVTVVHGDYRYGNLLLHEERISGVLDWEMAHPGDPLEDLVWGCRPFRPGTGTAWSVEELVRRYERLTGEPVDRRAVAFHRILAEVKSAIIYLRGLAAFRRSGRRDLSSAVPGQLIPYCVKQALLWIDELEGAPC